MQAARPRSDHGVPPWWRRRFFLLAMIALAAVPFLYPAIPPLIDLPTHIAHYHVELDLASSPALQRHFTFSWHLIADLGADLLVVPLAPIFGLETAVKLIVVATILLTAAAFLWIAREAHRQVPPTALLALPLAFNYPLLFGFLNYTLSMALALLAFGYWLRLSRRDLLLRRSWIFAFLAPAIWITHMMGWGILGILCFTAEVVRLRNRSTRWPPALGRALLACLPMAWPVLALLASPPGAPGFALHYGSELILTKMKWVIGIGRDRWPVPDLLFAALFYGFILYAFLYPRRWKRDDTLLSAGIALGLLFLLFPFTLAGSAFADVRLLPYAVALVILAFRPAPTMPAATRARWAGLALLAFLVKVAVTTASTTAYDSSYRKNLTALNHIERGSTIAMMVGHSCSAISKRWRHSRLDGLPNIATVRKDSVTNFQFTANNAQLLGVKPGYRDGDPGVPAPVVTTSPAPCPIGWPSIEANLARMDPAKFDYLWLIDVAPEFWPHRPWLTPIWQMDRAVLYSVRRIDNVPTKTALSGN